MDIIGGLLHVVLLFLWIPGALSYDNIALNKPASQSSSDDNLAIDPPPASRANDGNGTNVASMKDNSCIHTKFGETQARWRVDLGDIHWIDQVYITYRDWTVDSGTSAGRLGGFSIYVSDTENWWNGYRCYKNEVEPSISRTGYPCNAVGRYVTIYNDRNATDAPFPDYYYNPTTDKAVLELCEVEIDGCSSGTFGSNCNQICSSNCATRDICTYNNGTCFYGCDPGFYLPDCSSPCSANCYNNTCERSNGDCIGGCKKGYYTSTCSNKCPDNCMDNECEQSTGNCVTCKAGWKGEKCDQPKCDAGKYGSDCTESCPNCGGNDRCDFTTGVCTSGCDDRYHGTKCLLSCSVNCGGSGACNITTAACIGGCNTGWVGQTCDKEGCARAGYYGTDCTKNCPNCGGDGSCEFKTGKCIYGCKVEWIGDMCSENGCEENKYGQLCSTDCPENCGGDGACDFATGNCPQSIGCKDGWTGDKCDNVCTDNKYGKGCNQQCGTCYNGTCNHITGICPYGCLDGWKGSTCDVEGCVQAGYYWAGCTERCPNCGGDGTCEFQTGKCTFGCKMGWIGDMCSQKTQTDTNELNLTALILGLVLSVIIVALVVIIALMSRKRGATPTGNQPIEIEDINNYEAITSRDPEPNHIYSVMSGSSGRQGDNNTEEDKYTPLQPNVQDGADDHYYSDLELGK